MKDYLIVGLGLAGLSIAEELHKRQKSFHVLAEPGKNASKVAGGVINPLILKRFTLSWSADEFIPEAEKFYTRIEKRLGISIFRKLPIYRKIKSAEEQNNWYVAADKPDLKKYIDDELKKIPLPNSPFHFGKVNCTSLIDTSTLLEAYSEHLSRHNQLRFETFDYNRLKIGTNEISYKDYRAKKIIFCEGMGIQNNPFFHHLPLIGNKGEYLIVSTPQLPQDAILKTAIAFIPLGKGFYKVGATYSRSYKNDQPEERSKHFLITKLEELIDGPYEIVNREAGIRPTVLDRRPLLGSHPRHSRLLICNGFGSHGLMIAPTAAKWLLNFDLHQKDLPKAVNVHRYFKD